MVKLNLGCWKRNFPGWINIDVIGYPHIHFKRDIKDLSIFEDESVDLVYASHCLEYFTLDDAKMALKEWCRVLKPGGELNVAVPDFEALVKLYQTYKDPLMLRGSIFAIVDKVLEHDGQKIFHKMIYDEALLTRLLKESGFTDIKRYDWKEFLGRFLPEGVIDRSASYLPAHDPKHQILVSLNMSARKAGSMEATIHKTMATVGQLANKVTDKAKRVFRNETPHKNRDMYKM